MWFKSKKEKAKEEVNRELVLYKKERLLEIDADVLERRKTNQRKIDEARSERIDSVISTKVEIAKLEASKEYQRQEVKHLKEIIDIKDNEISNLKSIIDTIAKSKVTITK